jgi:SAM-dependent methyltransferase
MNKIDENKKYLPEADEGVYEKVFECLELKSGAYVLDVPCGRGLFVNMLINKKLKIAYGDIQPDKCVIGGADYIDMNKELPYKSNIFDIVTCIEGIEHIENPHLVIREFNRVLKQGGQLLITTPNILNIKSRIRFLFSGTFFWFDSKTIYKNGHINPIPFFELIYILKKCGFSLEKIDTNRIHFFSIPFAWIIKSVQMVFFRRFEKDMNKPLLQIGDILVIRGRKIQNIA